jgi:hypothetical protein
VRSTQDRFGTFTFPRKRLGFHAKNKSAGTKIASQYGKCEGGDARIKAGITVTIGIGHVGAGIPPEKQPIHAKSTIPNPAARV